MARLAESEQARPDRHITYLADDAAAILDDVTDIEDWVDHAVVADGDGQIIGWLLGETDDEMGRVWWWGPFVGDGDFDDVADAMYGELAPLPGISEEELGPDDRHTAAARFALRHGFRAETASAVLRYTGGGFGGPTDAVPMAERHRGPVADLHDRLFPGTHSPGRMVVESDDPRLVVLVDDDPVGYVAVELQSDGSGYIDYLGVDPRRQRSGVGRRLVMAATDHLLGLGATSVNLTVRESNMAARALYASLGFDHERMIRPYRKGFSLDAPES